MVWTKSHNTQLLSLQDPTLHSRTPFQVHVYLHVGMCLHVHRKLWKAGCRICGNFSYYTLSYMYMYIVRIIYTCTRKLANNIIGMGVSTVLYLIVVWRVSFPLVSSYMYIHVLYIHPLDLTWEGSIVSYMYCISIHLI